ncbi:MAG: PAS domain S-box protein [Proteobacteria bacterium]|nr:PAS domain S-box protein [Pseudomonadota bacterium]
MTKAPPVRKSSTKEILRDIPLPQTEEPEISYKRLFESSQDGIFVLDFNTRRIVDVNPGICLLTGLSRSRLIAANPESIAPLRALFRSDGSFFEEIKADPIFRRENLSMENRDGLHIQVEAVCNMFHFEGREFIQCNLRDVTQHRLAEDQVRRLNETLEQRVAARTCELEGANRELEAFTYSVSHDLRAPLRHIMGFVEILEKEAADKLTDAQRRHLLTISGAARRMGELIDDLLAFSRIGRSEVQKVGVDMLTLVMEALDDLRHETKDRIISWKIQDLPMVTVDRSLMRQALVNLLSNAIKFTSKHSRAVIEIGTEPGRPDEDTIYIRDNGVGFNPRYSQKIFGVFERLNNADEFEGTGIGLANVQRIIRRHGGRVWALGKVDSGATFYFTLPRKCQNDS